MHTARLFQRTACSGDLEDRAAPRRNVSGACSGRKLAQFTIRTRAKSSATLIYLFASKREKPHGFCTLRPQDGAIITFFSRVQASSVSGDDK
jgi:hypothetical protein